jgi:uncharacterized protein (DUF433 family)
MTAVLSPEQEAAVAEIKARASVDEHVWIAPGRYSGEPCIGGHRMPTRQVADGILAGFGEREYTNGYDLTRNEVLVACWFEARHGRSRRLRKAWRKWLAKYDGELWSSEPAKWDAVPMPPAESEL